MNYRGEIIAVNGNRRVVYDMLGPDGIEYAHIEDGTTSYPTKPLLSILVRGYWKSPDSE